MNDWFKKAWLIAVSSILFHPVIYFIIVDSAGYFRCGPLIDLCRGPHVRHTGKVKAFTVTKVRNIGHWFHPVDLIIQKIFGVVCFCFER